MRAKLKLVLTAVVLCTLAACRKDDPIITAAKADFIKEHPKIEIIESGIRSHDMHRAVVYVRFVSTPATAFPPKPSIWEDEMVYENKDGKWQCESIKGGTYIRPAR
jgi:hypothetical protein